MGGAKEGQRDSWQCVSSAWFVPRQLGPRLHSELHLWVITNGRFEPFLYAIPIGSFSGQEEEEREEVGEEEGEDDDLHMLLYINSDCL